MKPPPPLGDIFGFLEREPDIMIIFVDQMACLTYMPDVGSVMYLIGAYDRDRGQKYNTLIAHMAKEASRN